MVEGAGQYSASGYIGAAVFPEHVTLSVKNFNTSAEGADLEAVLTINGNLAKRQLDLGPLPATSDAFDLVVPPAPTSACLTRWSFAWSAAIPLSARPLFPKTVGLALHLVIPVDRRQAFLIRPTLSCGMLREQEASYTLTLSPTLKEGL